MKMKKLFFKASQFKQRVSMKLFEKMCILSAFMMCNPVISHATNSLTGENAGITEWPWTRFFNSLVNELTGPLPLIIGALGIVGAAGAMIYGNFGASVQKLLGLIAGVSIILFAPAFMNYLSSSVGNTSGLTIFIGM